MQLYKSVKYLIFLSFLLSQPVLAATLNITVLEKGTGDPVDGATVVLGETGEYSTSGKDGKVTFEEADLPVKLKILGVGYETVLKDIDEKAGSHVVKVYLPPVTMEGLGLEVVADRIPEKVSKVVMSAEELSKAPGSQGDPLKVLDSLPGVVSAAEGTGVVYMRGSGVADNAFFVNRLPIGYLYHFGGLQSTVNANLVSDLNIFLAGFPVEYGDNMGGVVDVKLRAPKKNRRHYDIHLASIEGGFLAEGPVGDPDGKNSFFVAARRSYIDLLLSPSDLNKGNKEDDNRIITVPKYYDVQGLFRHEFNRGNLDFYYFNASDKLEIQLNKPEKSNPQLAGELSTSQSYQTVGLNWQQQWNSQWDQIMPLGLYSTKQNLRIGTSPDGSPYYVNAEQINLFWQPELRWQYNETGRLSLGLEYQYYHIPLDLYIAPPPLEGNPDSDFTSAEKYRVNKTVNANYYAPYLKQRKKWTDKLTTEIGIRYSTLTGTGGVDLRGFSPRASVEYNLTDSTLLTASWGKYIQIPQGFELIDGFGNPGLEFQKAEHRTVGIKQQLNPLWSVRLEAYQKPMKDLVVSVADQSPPDNYLNKGKGNAYGLDLFIKREPTDRKIGWLSYSYAKSTRTNLLTGVERNFSGDQPHTVTAVWSQPMFGSWAKKWNWGFKFQAHTGSTYTPVIGRHLEDPNDPTSRWIPDYAPVNSERTPTYYRLDLRFDYTLLLNEGKFSFFLELLNATVSKNIQGYDYGNEYQRINNPREITSPFYPIFPVIGLEAEF